MSFLEHLEELRRRLIVCLVAIAGGTAVSFFFSDRLMEWLLRLAQYVPDLAFQALEVPEKFVASMRLALTAGIALAFPVLVYQAWRFLSPGLYQNERRYVRIGLPLVTFFFLAGVAFSYFVALPAALRFLLVEDTPLSELARGDGDAEGAGDSLGEAGEEPFHDASQSPLGLLQRGKQVLALAGG